MLCYMDSKLQLFSLDRHRVCLSMYLVPLLSVRFVACGSVKSLEELLANHLYINDLSMHDCSRDMLLASVQQSAELQQSLEQVPSFTYDIFAYICI